MYYTTVHVCTHVHNIHVMLYNYDNVITKVGKYRNLRVVIRNVHPNYTCTCIHIILL